MLSILIGTLGILITVLFVIGTHESAHFLAARLLGVKVLRFSIGFGKTLWSRRDKTGTEYVLALIPLGGYVQMLDEREGQVDKHELPLAYNRQPFYKKTLIVLAGPAINILCAILLYWLIFVIGFVTMKPIIGTVHAHSIASEAGMQGQQEIIRIDNVPTQGWMDILFRVLMHAGNQDHIKIETKAVATQKTQTYLLDLSNWHLNELNPDPLVSLGLIPYEPPIPLIIGTIVKQSPAALANLKMGDKIIEINKIKITTWDALVTLISSHPEQTVMMTLERNGKVTTLPVLIGSQRNIFLHKTGYLGIAPTFKMPPELLQPIKYSPLAAVPRAWQEVSHFIYFNLMVISKLITGKLSLQTLGGPITIFESAGEALNIGFIAFTAFLAFLSLSIGLINLLPIPGLDGGHLFIQAIEFIIRRPIPEKWLMALYRLGLLLIVFVLIQALVNDLLRL